MPNYDLAVAGAGLGGLAAATLMARQGKRTVVIEPADTAGGELASIRRNDFLFSRGPNLAFGLERGGILQRFCSELGIHQNAAVLSPSYQVALPDHRVSVFRETGETLEEIAREFPAEIDAVRTFFRDLRNASEQIAKSRFALFRARRRNGGDFLKRYRFSADLMTFFDVQSICFFQRPLSALSVLSLVNLLDTGPLSMQGGFSQLIEQVLSVYLQTGGEIRYGTHPADGVLRKGDHAAGFGLPDGQRIDAGTVLINSPLRPERTMLLLGVREELIPVGMAREVLCFPDRRRPELLFTLSASGKDQESAAPRGMRTLTAAFPLITAGTAGRDDLLELVGGIMPFLERFVVSAEEAGSERRWALPEPEARKDLGDRECPSSLRSTRMKNLYVVSDNSLSPSCAISAAAKLAELVR